MRIFNRRFELACLLGRCSELGLQRPDLDVKVVTLTSKELNAFCWCQSALLFIVPRNLVSGSPAIGAVVGRDIPSDVCVVSIR